MGLQGKIHMLCNNFLYLFNLIILKFLAFYLQTLYIENATKQSFIQIN